MPAHPRGPTHVALLRGVNVGSRNRVAMADLRRVVETLGHTDVATYIQSGNVVFGSASGDTAALAAAIEGAIAAELAIRPRVVVLSRDDLARVVADNPFADEPDPKKVHAVLSGSDPDAAAHAEVAAAMEKAAARGSADQARLVGRTLYLHTPNGLGRSEVAAALTARPRAGSARSDVTARNWATVGRLLAMLDA